MLPSLIKLANTIGRISSGRASLSLMFIVYIAWWIIGNHQMLLDPFLQNNDVRTHVYTFHKYYNNEAIANDPVALEVINMVTPGIRGLYYVIAPLVNLQGAAKIVQGICFILILLPFFLVLNSQKNIFVMVVLLIFFTFHTKFLMLMTVGGFQRNFAVPTIVLWIVGSYIGSRNARYIAILLGALTYPPAVALLMASEFFFILINLDWKEKNVFQTKFKKEMKIYFALFILCLMVLAPYMILKRDAGPSHSLHEAQEESAFGPNGRIKALPFPNPIRKMIRYFRVPFSPSGNRLISSYNFLKPKFLEDFGLSIIATGLLLFSMVILIFKKSIPMPKVAICLIIASVGMYLLSRFFAFHLYWPRRYFEYGLPLACISAIAEMLPNLKIKIFSISTYWISFILIACVLIFLGDGITTKLGVDLDGRENYRLYEFFRNTPSNTRIACHPYDGDDVPFWSGRPTTGGFETLQPWFVDSWRRHKALTKEVLTALYATDINTVISFCQKEHITHLLLNTDRYGPNFRSNALMFEPFGTFLEKLLAPIDYGDLALNKAIENFVTFRDGPFVVVTVKDLQLIQK